MADLVNMDIVSGIESSGDPNAYNEASGATGLNQITPICLKEWNNYHPDKKYKQDHLFNPQINTEVAHWYMNKRIPQMLKYFKHPDTLENRLTAYNAGISRVGRNLPKETVDYINKYKSAKLQKWDLSE